MPITKDNFQATMGMASSTSGGYYKFLMGTIKDQFEALGTTADHLIDHGKDDQAKAAIRNIKTKSVTAVNNYLMPAAYYIQECYYAAVAGYPKTSIKLAKLAILLIRAVRYQFLTPDILLPANTTDWVDHGDTQYMAAYKDNVNQMKTAGTGAYARMVQIVGGASVTTDLERFLETTPFPYGDGGASVTIASAPNVAYIMSALNYATSLAADLYPKQNEGGIARLTRFLGYAKTYAPTANSVNDPLYKIRIYDYIQCVDIAISNSKTLATITSNIKTGIAQYITNRGTYNYKKRLRFLASLQDSLERAQGLLVDISSRTARDLDVGIMNTQRGWMDLSVASIVATEIISRITNLERLVDAIETGEQNIIDDDQTTESSSILSSLSTINNKLVELTNSINTVSRDNRKTDSRVSTLIQKLENARIEDGELIVDYQEPEESQLSGMNLLIETIRTAVYGSDMRTAIADAISMLRTETLTLINNVTALHNLYENRLTVRELDTYFSWQGLTAAEKQADVIYLLMDDNIMIYKEKLYYFTDVNGGRSASFGSVSLSYGDTAYDLSIYGAGDMQASDEVINEIDLSETDKDKGGDE